MSVWSSRLELIQHEISSLFPFVLFAPGHVFVRAASQDHSNPQDRLDFVFVFMDCFSFHPSFCFLQPLTCLHFHYMFTFVLRFFRGAESPSNLPNGPLFEFMYVYLLFSLQVDPICILPELSARVPPMLRAPENITTPRNKTAWST